MSIRLVFMGSPDFALPILRALAENYTLVGVVTQPDRPAGRGQALTPPPVKVMALEMDLPFIQPGRLKEPAALDQLRRWAPDLIVVAAFGQILRKEALDLPSRGCINVHGSLLPRWRGAAPIQAALLNGDEQTGITIMQMDAGMDTGPILSQRALPIQPEDTTATLGKRMAELGARLLIETLPKYLSGELRPQPQDNEQATYASMLKKEDGELKFNESAVQLSRRVRAFSPWPGAYTTCQGLYLKIHKAHAVAENASGKQPGEALVYQGLPAIACAEGLLLLDELQPAGKKSMPGKAFLAGGRAWGK